jgi:phosphoglycolate phosphatase-like HAD superfamily hydrolase
MPLESWNDGPTRTAVLEFVNRVTTEDSSAYVPVADRVAVFDNDGTLWCERPTYAQAFYALSRLRHQAGEQPEIGDRPVVKALLAGDLAGAAQHGLEPLAAALLGPDTGLTAEEFTALAVAWLDEARHPRFGVSFAELVYVPMLELLHHLEAHSFRVFVVTGGGVEFVRAVSHRIYGVSPDDVVGSAVELAFERRDGKVVLVRQPKLLGSPNEGSPKPINIQAHIGQRPILAAGNSAGDREMLEYTHTGELPSLCLVVDHDDQEREYAYAGASATDPTAEAILETAATFGWTVISMRDDWRRVFPG